MCSVELNGMIKMANKWTILSMIIHYVILSNPVRCKWNGNVGLIKHNNATITNLEFFCLIVGVTRRRVWSALNVITRYYTRRTVNYSSESESLVCDSRSGAEVKCEVRGGKMRGTGPRYQCEAMGNLRGWNVRGAADNWCSRRSCRMWTTEA